MRRASRETSIPNVTMWRVLRKRLHLQAYKLSLVQHLTDVNKVVHKEFCVQMFHWTQDDERFLNSVIFSDESTFHVKHTRLSSPTRVHLPSSHNIIPYNTNPKHTTSIHMFVINTIISRIFIYYLPIRLVARCEA
jgi:hypothetical protein